MMSMHLEPNIDGISDHKEDRSDTGDHDDFVIQLFETDKLAANKSCVECNRDAETESTGVLLAHAYQK